MRHRRAGPILGLALFALGLGLLSCVTSSPPREDDRDLAVLPGEPIVRVLIVEDARELKLAIDGPGAITPDRGSAVLLDELKECAVRADAHGISVGERAFAATSVAIVAERAGAIRVNGVAYRGELKLVATTKAGAADIVVRAIDSVRLEDYLEGVIGKEMPLGWPDQALRAQAIAARSYAVFHLKHAPAGLDHDVKNDQRSQVYGGVEPTGRARAIARSTEGEVLAWEGRLFEAYFHSTCGGETVPAAWNLGAPEIPPLAGVVCGKCDGTKHARWTREVPPAELVKALAPLGVVAPITRVETVEWPRGGYVKDVVVTHAGGRAHVAPRTFRTALGLKSTCFGVSSPDGAKLVIEGRGWGHGCGLCQTGAKGFAEMGLDGEAICRRYYPGSAIVKLY